jgi:phosphate uptake regulator
METKHILSSFDDDLNKLNNSLLKLGNGALDQFEKCINNFGTQNLEDIEKVVSADKFWMI